MCLSLQQAFTQPEESDWVWCVWVCVISKPRRWRAMGPLGLSRHGRNKNLQRISHCLHIFYWARSHNKRKSPISFVTSVRPSSCISAPPTGRIFLKFDIGELNENLSRNSKIWLKSHNSIGHFTWRPAYIYSVDSWMKYFVALQWSKWKPYLPFHGNTQEMLSTATCGPPTVQRIIPYQWQQR